MGSRVGCWRRGLKIGRGDGKGVLWIFEWGEGYIMLWYFWLVSVVDSERACRV